ncbi:RIO1 family-domain-containing protein [Paraphysoderma sedebokerense]|nr:RIO1 family-domain-containing protein [Paraphysoderma sedebokerense]
MSKKKQNLSSDLVSDDDLSDAYYSSADDISFPDDFSPASISTSGGSSIITAPLVQRLATNTHSKNKDKSDRATTEQVLDPRTRMILFKMLNRNIISEINGCISTGKEANVYHAVTEDGQNRAIKVYKTSILVFKDRDRYVTGEYRFRQGYSKHNPRKMVKVWAEKEMRNLKRIRNAGIPSPDPLLLKLHVLVMEFLGNSNGHAAPRLKDAPLDTSKYREVYYQLVKYMWVMYNICKLVHADLSEYNMLYHDRQLWIIDVSQSVEHDHPHSLEFLRKDCTNVTEYFKKKGVEVLTVRELFEFVTNESLKTASSFPSPSNLMGDLQPSDLASPMSPQSQTMSAIIPAPASLPPLQCPTSVENELDRLIQLTHTRSFHGLSKKDLNQFEVEEEVFKKAYIPRHLDEVVNMEGDIYGKVIKGEGRDLLYSKLLKNEDHEIKEKEKAFGEFDQSTCETTSSEQWTRREESVRLLQCVNGAKNDNKVDGEELVAQSQSDSESDPESSSSCEEDSEADEGIDEDVDGNVAKNTRSMTKEEKKVFIISCLICRC